MNEKTDHHAPRGRVTAVDTDDEHEIEPKEREAKVDQDPLRLLRA